MDVSGKGTPCPVLQQLLAETCPIFLFFLDSSHHFKASSEPVQFWWGSSNQPQAAKVQAHAQSFHHPLAPVAEFLFFVTGEPLIQQASKQIQVDLQDLGYETCGRSENEVDREEATSPGNVRSSLMLAPKPL